MATAAGIFNHYSAAADALGGRTVAPMDTSNSSSSSTSSTSDSDSATISANDFLTLLVTEMQNQDPTADTDPNEYVNQLVQVNSLQQLIGINQTLTGAFGTSSSSSSNSTTSGDSKDIAQSTGANASSIVTPPGAAPASAASKALSLFHAAPSIAGNLSVPTANPSAQGVAHALDGKTRAIKPGL